MMNSGSLAVQDGRPARYRADAGGDGGRGSSALVLVASPIGALRRLWREGIRKFATAEAIDRAQLVKQMSERDPVVVLLDLDLPQLGGIDGIAVLCKDRPAARVVVLASRPDEREGILALKAGAKGYCDRAITPPLLGKALDMVLDGEIWIGRKLTSHLLDELSALAAADRESGESGDDLRALHRLTPRERDILDLLAIGATNKEISQRLAVTERTVKAHLTAVFRKLGISGRVQAALYMLEQSRAAHMTAATSRQPTT